MLLPLLFRCRPLGCVYLLAPWDIHAALGKAALQETAALLATGTFRALVMGGVLQQQWYAEVLSEGPMPPPTTPAAAAAGSDRSNAGEAAAEEPAVQCGFTPAAQDQVNVSPSSGAAALAAAQTSSHAGSLTSAAADTPDNRQQCSNPSARGANGYTEGLRQGACLISTASLGSSMGVHSQHPTAVCTSPMHISSVAAAATAVAGNNSGMNTCVPVPLSTTAAASQAASATMAPVGLPVSGHACGTFPELVLWPELLDVKDDLARSRHTVVSAWRPRLLA